MLSNDDFHKVRFLKCLVGAAVFAFPHFMATAAFLGDKEALAASKVRSLGGDALKNSNGKVDSIILLEKFRGTIGDLTDEDLEAIDFGSFSSLKQLNFGGRKTTDRSMTHLAKIPTQLDDIAIADCNCTDKGLIEFFKTQRSLRALCLLEMRIADRVMPEICEHEELRYLSLIRTPITDKGLVDLPKLTNLISLDLPQTQISDVGLAKIAEMENLLYLDLSGTKVTDKGIQQLAAIKSLRTLCVASTPITNAGVEALQALAPSLKISREKCGLSRGKTQTSPK